MKLFDCTCGAHALPANQIGIHQRAKTHLAWGTENGIATIHEYEGEEAVMDASRYPNPLPEQLATVVKEGKTNPVIAAKLVRRYMTEHPEFPGTPRDFLEAFEIPIIDLPQNIVTESAGRKYFAQRVAEIRRAAGLQR